MMLPSFHDDLLISYTVDGDARQIELKVRRWSDQTVRSIVFSGVEGYSFENDAFGNIIGELEVVSVETILSTYGSQIAESYRLAGAPAPWAADLAAAGDLLTSRAVQGFVISSSYGLSGWILAREAFVRAV
jgi:hypothetical protein